MEPVVNKLQEGVKYPRFERDATKTINDLVDHITKERGVYSSSIEPNPNEHSIWFNTGTNTLMIYNNGVWRNFSNSGSSSGWNVENALLYRNEKGNLVMGNIKDKTFYILNLDIEVTSYIEIPDLSDDIEFYIFISSMPERLYFPDSNIITNYDTIVRHTTTNNIVGMSVLAHKVGITVEFSIINDKTDASNKNYVYNTKAESALLPFIGKDNNLYYITKDAIVNENNLNQIEALLPSNVEHNGYIAGTLRVNGDVQIVYPPFKLPIDMDEHASVPDIVVFKNIDTGNEYYPLTIRSSTNYNRNDNLEYILPPIAIFDKFNPNNVRKILKTVYPQYINDDNVAIVIKDNWLIGDFLGLYDDARSGFEILIDDFPINPDYYLFNNDNTKYVNNIIINNHSDTSDIRNVLYTLCCDQTHYSPYGYSGLDTSDIPNDSCTIIFTTTCKTNMIFIPCYRDDEHFPIFIILPYKVNNFEIMVDGNLSDCGNIVIVTIQDNYDIINNYIHDEWSEGKPISEIDNIHINTTLEIESKYDEKGLSNEHYKYLYNHQWIRARFHRIDTPLIG